MASRIEGLSIAHGGANSNASLGLNPNAADTAAIARNSEKPNATASRLWLGSNRDRSA
jgi:hypothetical protein